MKNRNKLEKKLFSMIKELYPDEAYIAMLKNKVSAMSDKRFEQFIREKELKIISSPFKSEVKLDNSRALEFLKRYDRNPFQRITIEDEITGIVYSPTRKYMVLPVPCKRVVQTLFHKRSIPTNLTHIDQRTDQLTGASKGSRISNTEAQIINSQGDGYPNTLREFYKYRGGDTRALNAMNKLIIAQGGVKHATLNSLGSRPKSVEVLGAYYTAQHFKNNV